MNNSKFQAALDELERLHGTIKKFKSLQDEIAESRQRCERAISTLEAFSGELKKLKVG